MDGVKTCHSVGQPVHAENAGEQLLDGGLVLECVQGFEILEVLELAPGERQTFDHPFEASSLGIGLEDNGRTFGLFLVPGMLDGLIVIVWGGKVHFRFTMLMCFDLLTVFFLGCQPFFLGFGFHVETTKVE